ncbi:MAG: phosphoribosylamine--glycine ligase, partial [Gemmatimonadetes bacterium]|nr:phosphoribosylamine--glycine ligase [Gemmatimonadota bacterium]
QSPLLKRLYVAPGNGGTAAIATNLPIDAEDIPALVTAARRHDIGLTVVGPEAPLAAGIVDAFQTEGLPVFGPTRAAARIEASKVWAKGLMRRHGIPTARAEAFDSIASAHAYIDSLPLGGAVVKADGLAAGKGVVLAATKEDAKAAAEAMLSGRAFGQAGKRIVVEERLDGPEVSVFALVDGEAVSPEIAACDYKRALDGDRGPNTGGMGAYSPPEHALWNLDLAALVRRRILQATASAMASEGCPFRGVLYAGLMLTDDGPKVLEYNCRFGDPEAQVTLPRLESDLLEACLAVAQGRLAGLHLSWGGRPRVAVVMASGGYPGTYTTGHPIAGLEAATRRGLVFHAGTRHDGHCTLTLGGRVLAAVGEGDDIAAARAAAYTAVKQISFEGAVFRTDIAARALEATG